MRCSLVGRMASMVPRTVPRSRRVVPRSRCSLAAWTARIRLGTLSPLARVGTDGLLLSELPPGAAPTKWRFLQRGRLLAALSGTVLIAEAGYRSGSLHTAARAIELGRPVGAIPGPLTSAASAGCHRLMRDGLGSIITGYDDVRELLHGVREGAHRAVRERAGLEANPLDQQSPGPWRIPQSPGL